jgi:hypothetical protein
MTKYMVSESKGSAFLEQEKLWLNIYSVSTVDGIWEWKQSIKAFFVTVFHCNENKYDCSTLY